MRLFTTSGRASASTTIWVVRRPKREVTSRRSRQSSIATGVAQRVEGDSPLCKGDAMFEFLLEHLRTNCCPVCGVVYSY